MRFLWSSTLKDLRRHWNDPLTFALWIGIPLAIGLLITMATGGRDGPSPSALLYVADEDDSFLSRILTSAFDSVGDMVETVAVSQEEGQARLDDGEGTGLVVIPDGFGQALLEETPVELVFLTNPSQRILPGIIEEVLSIVCDGSFYLHRILGDELQEIARGPATGQSMFPDTDVARLSVQINDTIGALQEAIDPPAIALALAEAPKREEEDQKASYGLLFLPGVLFMALFFTAQGLSDDLWRERAQGTLHRFLSTPRNVALFLGGKLLSGMIVVFMIAVVGLVAGAWYFEVRFGDLPVAVAWTVFSGGVLLAGMFALQTLASSQRAGAILTNTIMFPLLMVGGSFFPLEAMPDWMADIGRKTPNGWAVTRLKLVLSGAADLGSMLPLAGILAGTGAVLFWFCLWRLRRGFAGN